MDHAQSKVPWEATQEGCGHLSRNLFQRVKIKIRTNILLISEMSFTFVIRHFERTFPVTTYVLSQNLITLSSISGEFLEKSLDYCLNRILGPPSLLSGGYRVEVLSPRVRRG
jgi:hypothetical protein